MEWTPCLPPRICRGCSSAITDFLPFYVLCRESAQKWNQTINHLSSVTVNKQATTAYILLGDEPQTIVDRSVVKHKTRKGIIKTIKARLSYSRTVKKRAKVQICNRIGSQKFQCPDCKKSGFDKICKFNFHLNTNKKHCCPHCFLIMNMYDFGKHLKIHNVPSFECKVCHLHFEKESHLRKHKKYHNKGKFVCSECKYTYQTMDGLTTHTSIVHSTIRCSCDLVFHGKMCYFNHKKFSCPKKRPQKYICDYCGKECNRKCILKNHIELIHMNSYIEQCDVCGKTFKNKAHLKEHKYAHDKKPDRFTCEYCGNNYSTPRGYRKHMTRKHYLVNPVLYQKKKYPCDFCDKVLLSELNLSNHIERQHKLPQKIGR